MRTFEQGEPVKYVDLEVGDTLIVDDRFECLPKDLLVTVQEEDDPENNDPLYVNCKCGRHYLDGQIDWDGKDGVGEGYLVGMRLATFLNVDGDKK